MKITELEINDVILTLKKGGSYGHIAVAIEKLERIKRSQSKPK